MKIKKIALITSIIFSSNLAVAAISEVPSDLQSTTEFTPLLSEGSNDLVEPEFSISGQAGLIEGTYNNIFKLLKTGQLEAAAKQIKVFKEQHLTEPDAYNLQALLNSIQKAYAPSIQDYQHALKLDPKNLRATLGLTAVYLQTEQLTKAKEYANASIAIDDQAIAAYFFLAEIAAKQGRNQEIESLLLTAQEKTHGYIKYELMVANRLTEFYIAHKQPEKSLKLAQDIAKRYPYHSSALGFLAKIQILNHQTSNAINTLEDLVSNDNNDSFHRLLLAGLLAKYPGNDQKILQLMQDASVISPNNSEIQIKKTVYLTRQKKLSAALDSAKKVKQLLPDSGKAELLEGDIYLAKKNLGLALAAYQTSYNYSANTYTLNLITQILVAQKKHQDAIAFLEQQYKNPPKSLQTENPSNVVVINNLAWLYHLQNDPRSVGLAAEAYKAAPQSAAVADSYGVILVAHDSISKGIKVLKKARKLAPSNYDVSYHLADAYVLNGQHRQAIAILKPIVNSSQNFAEKAAATSLLNKLK